jgi:phage shock protein A
MNKYLIDLFDRQLKTSTVHLEDQARLPLRQLDLELKQALSREKALVQQVTELQQSVRRGEQEIAAVRDENMRMRSQTENVEGLLKVLSETEDVLKRKVS